MKKCLNGNTILIIDMDQHFAEKLSQALEGKGAYCFITSNMKDARKIFNDFDLDLVVCSYYLPDGLIHHLIDWCRDNLSNIPVFVALGQALPADDGLRRRSLISDVLQRSDNFDLAIKCISDLLFDYDKFRLAISEMVDPRGIEFELMINKESFEVKATEIFSDSLSISFNREICDGSHAILRVSLFESGKLENFIFMGSMENAPASGHIFKINDIYNKIWQKFMLKL